IHRHEVDLEPEPRGHGAPEARELAGLEGEHLVAGRERVGERRFPGAGAGGGEDDHGTLGAEDPLDAGDGGFGELGELRTSMVDGRPIDGAQNPVWNVGRAGDLQKMPSGTHSWLQICTRLGLILALASQRIALRQRPIYIIKCYSAGG